MNPLGLQELKVVALAVDDMARACDFYRNTLGLVPALDGGEAAFALGNATLMLKMSGNG